MAMTLEGMAPVDRDSEAIWDLKDFDRALVRIHRVCHNAREEAMENDVRQQWTLNPPWRL